MHIPKIVAITIALLCLCGCDDTQVYYAPVTDAAMIEPVPQAGSYKVVAGDTLYSIAWRYGLDYRYVAQRNNIAPPYHIEPGQRIYLKGKPTAIVRLKTPTTAPVATVVTREPPEPNRKVKRWTWPAQGPVVGEFSDQNKGINIGGHDGDPILATASGKVVYSGHGLRGYGNLIIIKHNSSYLTAYAHNRLVFVKEGESVKAGQKIAEMGHSGSRKTMLHFEIRRNGQPVNPMLYLP